MRNMQRIFPLILIAVLAFSSLTVIFATTPSGLAQSGTNVNGIISQDTTWTMAGSPYILTGPIAVDQGVTLTIEAGVTVDIGNYYMQVNGTLSAKGTSTNLIYFNGGSLNGMTFTGLSNGWNGQTGTGCIIENAIINPPLGASSSIRLDHDTFQSSLGVRNSSSITNSNIEAGVEIEDEAVLSNNVISGAITGPSSPNGLTVSVTGSLTPNSVPTIANNIIHSGTSDIGISCFGCSIINNNSVTGGEEGIRIYSGAASGYPIVNLNTVTNNQDGIVVQASSSSPAGNSPSVQHNLIADNLVGISVEIYEGGTVTPTIQNNDIYDNKVNLGWALPSNFDASNNWWGTTDQQEINQSISDSKSNFNFGTVNFVPFLTAPDPQAPSLSIVAPTSPTPTATPISTPSSTPNLSQTPTSTAAVPEFSALAILPLLLSLFAVAIVVRQTKTSNFKP